MYLSPHKNKSLLYINSYKHNILTFIEATNGLPNMENYSKLNENSIVECSILSIFSIYILSITA